jgi:hypothetical protein
VVKWADIDRVLEAYLPVPADGSLGVPESLAPVVTCEITKNEAGMGFGGFAAKRDPSPADMPKQRIRKSVLREIPPAPRVTFNGPVKSSTEWTAEREAS